MLPDRPGQAEVEALRRGVNLQKASSVAQLLFEAIWMLKY
jgi:hypothetical protein